MRTPIMSCCRLMAVALFLFCSMPLFAQRQDILLNDNWKFRFSHQVQKGSEIRDRKSTRLNSSHMPKSRMPSSA